MANRRSYSGADKSRIFTWQSTSRGLNSLGEAFPKFGKQFGEIGQIFAASRALNQARKQQIQQQYDQATTRAVQRAQQRIAAGLTAAAASLSDPALKLAVRDARNAMNEAARGATTLAEKQKALSDAQIVLARIARRATGGDNRILAGRYWRNESELGLMGEGLRIAGRNRRGLEFQRVLINLWRGGGNILRTLVPLKRALDITNGLFVGFNQKMTQFARLQMQIASERGGFGRKLSGAGIRASDMVAGLKAARLAGISDQDAISQAVNLQKQIALSQWGEGGLIQSLGRWGLSPFKEGGRGMKSQHEVRIEQSRLLNRMNDPMMQLQAMSHWGISPEQKEWIMRYAEIAEKQERNFKRGAVGTFENAEYLDKSGYYAKADAAIKAEQRRQQIVTQDAASRGLGSYLKRMINPETWLLSDVLVRERGTRTASAQMAYEKLQKEGASSLTAKDRKVLSYLFDDVRRNLGKNYTKSEEYQLQKTLERQGFKFNVDMSPLERLNEALTNALAPIGSRIEGWIESISAWLEGPNGTKAIETVASAIEKAAKKIADFLANPKKATGETILNNIVPIGLGVTTGVLTKNWKVGAATTAAAATMFADGGIVPGPRGQKGDKVLIRANPGELILNEAQQQVVANRLGGLQRFAEGGIVAPAKNKKGKLGRMWDAFTLGMTRSISDQWGSPGWDKYVEQQIMEAIGEDYNLGPALAFLGEATGHVGQAIVGAKLVKGIQWGWKGLATGAKWLSNAKGWMSRGVSNLFGRGKKAKDIRNLRKMRDIANKTAKETTEAMKNPKLASGQVDGLAAKARNAEKQAQQLDKMAKEIRGPRKIASNAGATTAGVGGTATKASVGKKLGTAAAATAVSAVVANQLTKGGGTSVPEVQPQVPTPIEEVAESATKGNKARKVETPYAGTAISDIPTKDTLFDRREDDLVTTMYDNVARRNVGRRATFGGDRREMRRVGNTDYARWNKRMNSLYGIQRNKDGKLMSKEEYMAAWEERMNAIGGGIEDLKKKSAIGNKFVANRYEEMRAEEMRAYDDLVAAQGGGDAIKAMQAVETATKQASATMNGNAELGAAAAASAPNAVAALGGVLGGLGNKGTEVNVGGVNVSLNINGSIPIDENGVRQGLQQGAEQIEQVVARAVINATRNASIG